jgi:hypothetical protein
MSSIAKFLAGLLVGISLAVAAVELPTFSEEAQAQHHCPTDTVVWLNLPTMIWHYKGQRWYGRTQHGAYACEKEAAASGARSTHNGQ